MSKGVKTLKTQNIIYIYYMLGLSLDAKSGLLVFPLLFLGYTATDYFLQFLNTGVNTRCDIDVIDHKFSIVWKIGKTITDK